MCSVEFEPTIASTDRWFSRAGKNQFNPRSAVDPDSLKTGWLHAKIIIPKEQKEKILQLLASKGITEEYLFPN